MDAGDDQQSKMIRDCFAKIKKGTKPPFPVGSRPGSSFNSDVPPEMEGSPMSEIGEHADSGSQDSLPSQMSGVNPPSGSNRPASRHSLKSQMSGMSGDTADGEGSSLGSSSFPDRTRAQSIAGGGAGPQIPPQLRGTEAPTPETPSRVTQAGTRESTGSLSPSNRRHHRTGPLS